MAADKHPMLHWESYERETDVYTCSQLNSMESSSVKETEAEDVAPPTQKVGVERGRGLSRGIPYGL